MADEGFYSQVASTGFELMTEPSEQNQFEDVLPSQVRRAVSEQNQFQLPAAFVTKVGFQSGTMYATRGAMVAWYYHEEDDKAVLGSDAVDPHPTLELVGTCRLTGVSNRALADGDATGARVTIISELPEAPYERLTRGSVVLKPVYTDQDSNIDATYVSVYPAKEYDHGTLPNVDRGLCEIERDDGSVQLQSIHNHANSI